MSEERTAAQSGIGKAGVLSVFVALALALVRLGLDHALVPVRSPIAGSGEVTARAGVSQQHEVGSRTL